MVGDIIVAVADRVGNGSGTGCVTAGRDFLS